MNDALQIQISLNASPGDILRAWTDALPDWFAEHANVSISEKRYDFWGRYTPGTPDRENGQHPLLDYQADHSLKFRWALAGEERDIEISLYQEDEKAIVIVRQEGGRPDHEFASVTHEDFWFLSLENLRRHLDGKPPIRCDFSASMVGDIHHSLDIDAPRESVYETLIRPDQLERWIASHATVEPHVGGRYDLGWPNNSGALRILEIVPNEKLSLAWPENERETVVTWTLEGSGGKTRLTLVHGGFASDEPTEGLKAGWMNFMSWIKSLNEYGATWQPAVMRLQPESATLYAASIIEGQADLVPGTHTETSGNTRILGDYVEILTAVRDSALALNFYTALGFRPLSDTVVTDGSINIHLSQGSFVSPTLYFMGADLTALEKQIPVAVRTGDQITFTDPNGLRVVATSKSSAISLPDGHPMSRTPISRLGKFGELAIAVKDFAASAAFWGKLGFQQMYAADEPYPWGIFTDGLILLGLHQDPQNYEPTITYFAGDMAERIAAMGDLNITVTPVPPNKDGITANASFSSPDGQKFFMFQGEI